MPPDMKHIIHANTNVKVYSWPLTFREVVRQQIWGEVAVLIPASSADPFWIIVKNYENWSTVAEVSYFRHW